MILDRMRLAAVLDLLKMAVGNKVMNVSFYVKFVIDKAGQAIYLNSTDYYTFLVVSYGDCDLVRLDDVPDVFLVKFDHLYNLVKFSTTTDIELVGSGDKIVLTTDGKFNLPTFAQVEQFPVADFNNTVCGEWDADELRSVWDKISIAVSQDVTKTSFQGINYDGHWAASDNRRFAVVRGDREYDGPAMLIPQSFGEVIRKCQGVVKMGRGRDGNMFVISNEGTGMLAAMRLIDSSFAPYQRLIDARTQYVTLTLPKQVILGALQRIGCLTDKLFKVCKLTVNVSAEDEVLLGLAIEHSTGDGSEVVEATDFDLAGAGLEPGFTGEVTTFNYHVENLAAGIGAVDSKEEVVIQIADSGKLWVDEGNFTYLLSRIQ